MRLKMKTGCCDWCGIEWTRHNSLTIVCQSTGIRNYQEWRTKTDESGFVVDVYDEIKNDRVTEIICCCGNLDQPFEKI